MRAFRILGFLSILATSLHAEDAKLAVVDSGSREVDAAVVQLISQRPAPFPSGYSDPEIDSLQILTNLPYMTPQVSNAMAKLKAMGPSIYPALIKHLRDDRYSYSDIVAAWDNYTVGDAVIEIVSDGHYMWNGYKFRKTPSGTGLLLSFKEYLMAKEPEKWAEWAKSKTKLDIQMDFIDWCVGKEKARGFVDTAQEKELLKTYQQARDEVRKQYSKDGSTR
jgi:hypothetical protein